MSRSTITTEEHTAYHHGDLRNALLDAARAVARESGADAITIREVTRRAGVSHAAAYHHFANRTDLLRAVALLAFHEFTAELEQASGPDAAGLERMAIAYLRFATAHSAEFRFMFSSELCAPAGLPDPLSDASLTSQDVLRQQIRTLQSAGVLAAGDLEPMVLAAWSQIHGLTMIALETRVFVGAPDEAVEDALRRGVRLLIAGLRPE